MGPWPPGTPRLAEWGLLGPQPWARSFPEPREPPWGGELRRKGRDFELCGARCSPGNRGNNTPETAHAGGERSAPASRLFTCPGGSGRRARPTRSQVHPPAPLTEWGPGRLPGAPRMPRLGAGGHGVGRGGGGGKQAACPRPRGGTGKAGSPSPFAAGHQPSFVLRPSVSVLER